MRLWCKGSGNVTERAARQGMRTCTPSVLRMPEIASVYDTGSGAVCLTVLTTRNELEQQSATHVLCENASLDVPGHCRSPAAQHHTLCCVWKRGEMAREHRLPQAMRLVRSASTHKGQAGPSVQAPSRAGIAALPPTTPKVDTQGARHLKRQRHTARWRHCARAWPRANRQPPALTPAR
jgi:hypothetical protein